MSATITATTAADASPQRRKVRFDFAESEAQWNPRHEQFAHLVNAIGTMLPYLERFLVDCVDAAAERVPESNERLRREMRDFCYQERRHHANHARFNKVLAGAGYADAVSAAETKLERYYRRLRSRDARYGLAWCEGFETVAPFMAVFMFERAEEFGLDDWSDPTNALWLWHMGEEFEHRTVCNEAYEELYGHYPTRMRGLWSATMHLFTYSLPLAWKMAQRDWAELPRPERFRNQRRFATMLLRLNANIVSRLVGRAMRPGYDPASLAPPDGMQELLDRIADEHGIDDR